MRVSFLVASLEPMVWLRERKRKKGSARAFFGLAGMHCEDGGHGTRSWACSFSSSSSFWEWMFGRHDLAMGRKDEMDGAWFGSLLLQHFFGSELFSGMMLVLFT